MQAPVEIIVLAALAVLAASLWIPFVIGINTEPAREGEPDPFHRPPDPATLRPWVHRAFRAHLNLLEQFLPFAVLILILDRLNGFTALTAWTAVAFGLLRLVHAVGMITGVVGYPWRPIVFTAGWVAILILAVAVFLRG